MISKKMDDLLVVLDAVMGAVRIADAKRSRNGRRTPAPAATAEITT
jgi:hypothetical protein